MITLKDFLETTKFKITDGTVFLWSCYGKNARILSCDQITSHAAQVVFDTETQDVYEATVCDYENDRAYRLIHPDYKDAYMKEGEERGVDYNQAWDSVKYIDLETNGDFLEKLEAIINGETYDDRVVVPLDIDSDSLYKLMLAAHKEDLTLNEYLAKAIQEYVEIV
jgi:hypothetical protein